MSLKKLADSFASRTRGLFRKQDRGKPKANRNTPVQQRSKGLLAVGQTHVGLVRSSNQDAFHADVDSGLFVVADGMGGHKGGETASKIAVNVPSRLLSKYSEASKTETGDLPDENPREILQKIFAGVNSSVYHAASANPQLAGMGTTLIIARFLDGKCHMGHVGDVRGYLFREGILKQLTRDHSTVATLVESGHLTTDEAREHPLRNQIERAVGPFPQVEADVSTFEVRNNDIILLCSDGLWNMVRDEEIASELGCRQSLKKACKTLMEHALSAGGKDNVTVVLVQIL